MTALGGGLPLRGIRPDPAENLASLYRLTAADYSNGDYYHYTYDAVGDRLTQEKSILGLLTTDTYVPDDANRLNTVNGVTYTWDNNGNLLSDGIKTYTYDSANRLKAVSGQQLAISYGYNGLGDRLQEIVNGQTTTFMMDYNTGLTQVLNDGTNTYIYGNGRIAQVNTGTEYFLGDALGSVRQLTNSNGAVTYASAYDPYGVTAQTYGSSQTAYGYAGEYTSNNMVYLRSRYYSPGMGRFLTRDTWGGDTNSPMSFNRWIYVEGNPVNLTDPSGKFPEYCQAMSSRLLFEDCVRNAYGLSRPRLYTLLPYYQNKLTQNDRPGCYLVSPEAPIPYDAQGYLEGVTSNIVFNVTGTERVYDFSTMTGATFDVEGWVISDTILGMTFNTYFGTIGSLPGNGFSSQRTIEDYNGWSYFDSIGASIPTKWIIPTAGGYRSRFMSFALEPIMGVEYGIAVGVAKDIPILDIGIGATKATIRKESIRSYVYRNPVGAEFVDEGKLAHDIFVGNNSPWDKKSWFEAPLLLERFHAINMVYRWAKIYEDMHNGDYSWAGGE